MGSRFGRPALALLLCWAAGARAWAQQTIAPAAVNAVGVGGAGSGAAGIAAQTTQPRAGLGPAVPVSLNLSPLSGGVHVPLSNAGALRLGGIAAAALKGSAGGAASAQLLLPRPIAGGRSAVAPTAREAGGVAASAIEGATLRAALEVHPSQAFRRAGSPHLAQARGIAGEVERLSVLTRGPQVAAAEFDGSLVGVEASASAGQAAGRKLRSTVAVGQGHPEGPAATPSAVPSPGGSGGGNNRPGLRQRFSGWLPPAGERVAILLVAPLWNAFVIGAAYLINPIRLAFLQLDFDLSGVAASYVASGIALGISVWLYGKLARLPRVKIVTIATLALGGGLVGWAAVAALLAANPALAAWSLATPWFSTPALGKVFSFTFNLFGDVFAMMSVTVTATYIVDVFRGSRAKKYFPVIFGAGSLGGLTASAFVFNFVKSIGPLPIMLIAAAVYLTTLGALAYLERWSRTHPSDAKEDAARNSGPQAPVRLFSEALSRRFPLLLRVEAALPATVKLILSDPLLQLFFVLKLFERIVPDFANFVFESEMRAMFPGSEFRDAASAFRAQFAFWQQGASFLIAMLLSTTLIKRIGLAWATASPQVANAIGLASYAVLPGMGPAYALNQVEGGLRYVVMKPAVERGWAQIPKRVVYTVKAFIDSFTYRGLGKIISGLTLLVIGPKILGLSAATIAGLAVPLAVFAIYIALKFGAEVDRREAAQSAAAGPQAPTATTAS